MCLILLAYEAHPVYRLVVAANRDEFFARPTAPATFWGDAPQLLAGRDLQEGGTWLGITRSGRFAALTNYREPAAYRHDAPTRGRIVSDFLRGEMTPEEYGEFLLREGGTWNGFNLVFGTPDRLRYFSNRDGLSPVLTAGIHGISNHLLDTPWPKVSRGREGLATLLAREDDVDPESLFSLLADHTPAPDDLLPDTGVGVDWERSLSPLFISTPTYGTRSSTLLLVGRDYGVTFMERTFNGSPQDPRTVVFRFPLTF